MLFQNMVAFLTASDIVHWCSFQPILFFWNEKADNILEGHEIPIYDEGHVMQSTIPCSSIGLLFPKRSDLALPESLDPDCLESHRPMA